MQDPVVKRNLIILIGIILLLVGAVVAVTSMSSNKTAQKSETSEPTGDIERPTAKKPAPEPAKPSGQKQIDAGIRQYVRYGLSVEQLNAIKYTFVQFARQNKQDVNEIVFDMDKFRVVRGDPTSEDPDSKVYVTFTMGDTKYQSMVSYYGLFRIHAYVYDESGQTLLYDSGVVDSRNLPN